MRIDVLTLFPEMFSPLNESMMKLARDQRILEFRTYNFRENAVNKHGHVDDYPYGGGAGMLLRVEPIVETLEQIKGYQNARIILTDPVGQQFNQQIAQQWSKEEHLIFICGHYEGYDERIRHYVTDEVSIGDFVLTNGELPAMLMIDATVRLIPDALGNSESIEQESYQASLLEYPQYTRPASYRGMNVPEVLLSGHHENIAKWRRKESIQRTFERRPDLLEQANLTELEKQWLNSLSKDK